jgi:hypothetical protein
MQTGLVKRSASPSGPKQRFITLVTRNLPEAQAMFAKVMEELPGDQVSLS